MLPTSFESSVLNGVSVSVEEGVSKIVSAAVVKTFSTVFSVKSPDKVVTLKVKVDSEVVSESELLLEIVGISVVESCVEEVESEVDVDVGVALVVGLVVFGFKVVEEDTVEVAVLVVEVVVLVLVDRLINVLVTLAGLYTFPGATQ
jgi:hypothetical protein